MNAEFNWWLLIVGLVIGAGLVWLVLADSSRREVDLEEREMGSESRWIADALADAGRPLDDARVLEVLRLHRDYRAVPPPDDIDEAPDLGDPSPAAALSVDRTEGRTPMAHPIGNDPGHADHGTV